MGDYYAKPRLARGVGFGDLNNDGRTDMVINHTNEPVSILKGIGGEGQHWIGIELVRKDHACIVGSRPYSSRTDEANPSPGGGSYASSGDRRLLSAWGTKESGQLTVLARRHR
jgi:hypothetical protein